MYMNALIPRCIDRTLNKNQCIGRRIMDTHLLIEYAVDTYLLFNVNSRHFR